MEFDRARLMNNINTLIKDKNIKIGELENSIGISTGYLSKMSKADNESMPGIDLIWKLAQKLGTSVDMLVGGDFDRSNDNLFQLIRVLDKMKKDTDLHNIEWKRIPKEYYEKVKSGEKQHPLFVPDFMGQTKLEQYSYDSDFTTDPVGIFADCFEGDMLEFGKIYIMNLFCNTKDEGATPYTEVILEQPEQEYEHGIEDGRLIPICSTLGKGQSLEPYINELINCIEKHEADVNLNSEQKSIISAYMNACTDDELPFN